MEAIEKESPQADPSNKRMEASTIVLLDKKGRFDILSEAAELGRLTRLKEHVVEQVARPREDHFVSHAPPDGSIFGTSNFLIAIQEAAEVGKIRRLKPVVIENYREREEKPGMVHMDSVSRFNDSSRISRYLEEERKRKRMETPLERAQRNQEAMENVQHMASPISVQKPKHIQSNIPLRMREDVAKSAAKESHGRIKRIENEDNELKITFGCQCPHCRNASPFQTNFYKGLEKARLQRIKSQRVSTTGGGSFRKKTARPSLTVLQEDEDEEEEEANANLLKVRRQVEASIIADEERRRKEEEERDKADKHANIQAAKAILEKSLFQPKPFKAEEETSRADAIDPEVLYGNNFGKAFSPKKAIDSDAMDKEEWNQQEYDEQVEQEDLRQLSELYDRQDAGEKVDEERIYELELFDRSRRDAYLGKQEQDDLVIYRNRRLRTDKFIEEYEDVMNRLNSGEEIDEHRAYQLEYVVKKRGLSQDLTILEESAMIQFETEEYMKDGLIPADFTTSFGNMETTCDSEGKRNLDENNNDDRAKLDQCSLGSHNSFTPFPPPRGNLEASDSKSDPKASRQFPGQDVPDAIENSDSGSTSSSRSSLSDISRNSLASESSDDSSLSYYEKDELDDLIEYKNLGEFIDTHRYQDLMLFDRWKSGGSFNKEEMEHLNAYRRRRKIERNYRNEFADLIAMQATGKEYDEERFYHLQLYARRQVGQPLSEEEKSALEAFGEGEEEARREAEHQKQGKVKDPKADQLNHSASSNLSNDSDDDDNVSSASRKSKGDDGLQNPVTEYIPSIFDRVSRHSFIMGQEAKAKKKYAKKKTKSQPATVEDDGESTEGSETNNETNEGSTSDSSESVYFDGPSSGGRIEQLQDTNTMASIDSGASNSILSGEVAKKPQSPRTMLSYLDSEINTSRSDFSEKLEPVENAQYEQKGGRDGPSNVQEKPESDDSSHLSPEEFSDYLRLIEDKENGRQLDEERLQLLRLVNMWQFGETMTIEQEFRLDDFRRQRRLIRKLKKEFLDLLERSEKGEEVDEDRLYLLELFARKQVGEAFTEEEALDLKEFEVAEGIELATKTNVAPKGIEENLRNGEPILNRDISAYDESSLPSIGEVEELEELLKRQASDEDVDEKRLYTLQLLMKWQKGDELDSSESNDLTNLRYQRRKDRYYKMEFEELLRSGDEGGDVDDNRIYFLQLYARRLIGDDLSFDEVHDLVRFENEEKNSFEKEGLTTQRGKKGASNGVSENNRSELLNDPIAGAINQKKPEIGAEESDHATSDQVDNSNQPSSQSSKERAEDNDEKNHEVEGFDGSNRLLAPCESENSSDGSLSKMINNDLENLQPEMIGPVIANAAGTTLKAYGTPQITSRELTALDNMPYPTNDIKPSTRYQGSKPTPTDARKKSDHSNSSIASTTTTVALTEESSQLERQSTDERSAFSPSVIEVIRENSLEDEHEDRTMRKRPKIPEPIIAAMEANANLLKQLDDARLEVQEAREWALQEAAKRAAAEDNAKSAESETTRAREALATSEQQRQNLLSQSQSRLDKSSYPERMHRMERGRQDMDSEEDKTEIPESYLAVMSFNTKLLEQLNDTRQAALEAKEQANKEAAGRVAAENSAKQAEAETMHAREALAATDQNREDLLLIQMQSGDDGGVSVVQECSVPRASEETNPQLLGPYMAAMEANVNLLEQLEAARQATIEARVRANEEAVKRAAAEQNSKYAAAEADKVRVSLLESNSRNSPILKGHQRDKPGQQDDHLRTEKSNLSNEITRVDESMTSKLISLDPPEASTEDFLAEISQTREANQATSAQKRRERAMKTVAERRRRESEKAESRTAAESLEKEHRERIRIAVEERKRKTREAMEARKRRNRERSLRNMKINTVTSFPDEAIEAAKRAKALLHRKRSPVDKLSSREISLTEAPLNSDVEPGTSNSRAVSQPVPEEIFKSVDVLERVVTEVPMEIYHIDPPAHVSSDPPGDHYILQKSNFILEEPIQKDSLGDALRSNTFLEYVVIKGKEQMHKETEEDEITHEDWYSKMDMISESYNTGQAGGQQVGPAMSSDDWYQEIENLSKDLEGESKEDLDMKLAIEDAQRKAQGTNMQANDEVEKEMTKDIEAIRHEVMKMSKDEAVDQILRQVSSDVKNIGRSSLFETEPEASAASEAAYTIGSVSEVSSVSVGGGYELRSQHGAFIGNGPRRISSSNHTIQTRSSRRSAPSLKEKNHVSRVATGPLKRKATGRAKPTRMKNISWRSNPTDSFSDWKVEIKHKETGKLDTYYLHRNVLGYGTRKSEYFAKQFQEDLVVNGYYETNSPKSTQLDLPEAWARMFPMVLDFLYHNREKSLKLTANHACAMYKWAEFLGIPVLKTILADFYTKNITLKNFSSFMTSAVQLKAGQLVVAGKKVIGKLVTQQPKQAWRIAPKFLISILEANRKELIANRKRVQPQAFQTASCKWSKAIYYCVSKNKKEMTHKLFQDLTSESTIPVVDPGVAISLLTLDVELCGDAVPYHYSPFQKRCVQSIIQNWDVFRLKYSSVKALKGAFQKLPSEVLTEILVFSNNRSKSNPQTAV